MVYCESGEKNYANYFSLSFGDAFGSSGSLDASGAKRVVAHNFVVAMYNVGPSRFALLAL